MWRSSVMITELDWWSEGRRLVTSRHIHLPLSTNRISWYCNKWQWCSATGKVTVGAAKSNISLIQRLWLTSPVWLISPEDDKPRRLVGWSLTSLFSTNMAISETMISPERDQLLNITVTLVSHYHLTFSLC